MLAEQVRRAHSLLLQPHREPVVLGVGKGVRAVSLLAKPSAQEQDGLRIGAESVIGCLSDHLLLPVVMASARGKTGPEPLSSRWAATTVKVQRESTMSSTSKTGSDRTSRVSISKTFSRLWACW